MKDIPQTYFVNLFDHGGFGARHHSRGAADRAAVNITNRVARIKVKVK